MFILLSPKYVQNAVIDWRLFLAIQSSIPLPISFIRAKITQFFTYYCTFTFKQFHNTNFSKFELLEKG